MDIYATFNDQGFPTGFWPDDGIGPKPPEDAIKITEAQWQEFVQNSGRRIWSDTSVIEYTPPALEAQVPAFVALADWRGGLDLWMRDDGKGGKVSRLNDVYAAVKPLVDANQPIGKIALQQLEFSNFVHLERLKKIQEAFGFSTSESEESMWRAQQVANGVIDGQWPPVPVSETASMTPTPPA